MNGSDSPLNASDFCATLNGTKRMPMSGGS
jgi:hypothetical protein